MQNKIFLLMLFSFLIGCSAPSQKKSRTLDIKPIMDEGQVLGLVLGKLNQKYPDTFYRCHPFKAVYSKGVWSVSGTALQNEDFSGTPEAKVDDKTGEILYLFHSR